MWQTVGMGNEGMGDDLDQALSAVGARLRALRRQREITLADLSAQTGVSVSTLSRLESGDRKPTLELLLPLARAYGVTLDELVDAPPTGDDVVVHGADTGNFIVNGGKTLKVGLDPTLPPIMYRDPNNPSSAGAK